MVPKAEETDVKKMTNMLEQSGSDLRVAEGNRKMEKPNAGDHATSRGSLGCRCRRGSTK